MVQWEGKPLASPPSRISSLGNDKYALSQFTFIICNSALSFYCFIIEEVISFQWNYKKMEEPIKNKCILMRVDYGKYQAS